MGVFLAIALIAYVVTRTVSDTRIDHTYAKQGLVSPRLEAKYGTGAREKTARYGLLDFLGDAWSDHWQRRAAALEADREAYLANPGQRRRWRDRWAAATQTMAAVGRKFVEPVPTKAERGPDVVEELQPEPVPALAVDTGDVPTGTVRHTDDGREQWDGGEWTPIAETNSTTATSTGGTTMTAPTGEAVNYEMTVAELEKLGEVQRGHVDSCQSALKEIGDAKSAINDMQESYRASAAAASSMLEHLAAKNLDGVTLANAGTTADAMPAGVVDVMYDQLEAMEVQANERLVSAEAALSSTEANLKHIQDTYGAAHETVAGQLGGDSSFLDSGGGAAGGGGSGSGSTAQGGIHESGTGDISFTGVMGGGVKAPKIPSSGGGGYGIQHNGTGEVNVSNSAFGEGATVNNG